MGERFYGASSYGFPLRLAWRWTQTVLSEGETFQKSADFFKPLERYQSPAVWWYSVREVFSTAWKKFHWTIPWRGYALKFWWIFSGYWNDTSRVAWWYSVTCFLSDYVEMKHTELSEGERLEISYREISTRTQIQNHNPIQKNQSKNQNKSLKTDCDQNAVNAPRSVFSFEVQPKVQRANANDKLPPRRAYRVESFSSEKSQLLSASLLRKETKRKSTAGQHSNKVSGLSIGDFSQQWKVSLMRLLILRRKVTPFPSPWGQGGTPASCLGYLNCHA